MAALFHEADHPRLSGKFTSKTTGEGAVAGLDLADADDEPTALVSHPKTLDEELRLEQAAGSNPDQWDWSAVERDLGHERAADIYTRCDSSLGRALAVVNSRRPAIPGTIPPGVVGTPVSTQLGLDRAIAAGHEAVSIVGSGSFKVRHATNTTVHTFDEVDLVVEQHGAVVAHGRSRVQLLGTGAVTGHEQSYVSSRLGPAVLKVVDDAQGSAKGRTDAMAAGRSPVTVDEEATARTFDQSYVLAKGHSYVAMKGESVAQLEGHARVVEAGPGKRITVVGKDAGVDSRRAGGAALYHEPAKAAAG